MRTEIRAVVLSTVTIMMLFFHCSTPERITGGNSSETVIGVISNSDGSPAASTVVSIFPVDYNPVTDNSGYSAISDTTDVNGVYRLEVNDAQHEYSLLATSLTAGTRLFITEVITEKDTSVIYDGTLRETGTITLSLPEKAVGESEYAYIPGTDLFATVNISSSVLTINSVPAGLIPRIIYSSTDTTASDKTRFSVTVESGDTTRIENMDWKYACRVYLNTSAGGASVQEDVLNFPVCIRLTENNFPFSQATSGGTDIRFKTPNGFSLPYETELWDTEAENALVWITVDTVHGNDSLQFITMYWGNADAVDSSDGASVFDTSNSFIGVWHLNENPSGGDGSIKDRSINSYNATPYGSMAASNSIDGITGKALAFDGTDDYLNSGNVSVPENYTMGLWVRLETLSYSQRFIFKDASYTLWYDSVALSIRMEHRESAEQGTWWRGYPQNGGTAVPMTKGIWHYFTATFDGSAIRLYNNGDEVSVSNDITGVPLHNANPLLFGKSWDIDFVNGSMDEIRIEGTARPAAWIKLCYMNQREDDRLVYFK